MSGLTPKEIHSAFVNFLPYGTRFCVTGSYVLSKAPGFSDNINILAEDSDELEDFLKKGSDSVTTWVRDLSSATGIKWTALTEAGNQLGLPKDIELTVLCLQKKDYQSWHKANDIMCSLSFVSRPQTKAQRVSMFTDLVRYVEGQRAYKATKQVQAQTTTKKEKHLNSEKRVSLKV
jgi:hypothetical protein